MSRAQGCLAGQIAGDSLGSLVEFETAAAIAQRYPDGVRQLRDGGTWGTLAGQPTDDSELALALARSLAQEGHYDVEAVARAYAQWYLSGPFDMGGTIRAALSASAAVEGDSGNVAQSAYQAAHRSSQANGALMRISPLGIFGVRRTPAELAAWARADACLTHPHPVCQDSNVVYTAAVRYAIHSGGAADRIYGYAVEVLESEALDPAVGRALLAAESKPPADYQRQQGWVVTALQNAFFQLLHAPNLEEGIVDTVRRGGDTDTNGAIAGALLGAAWGLQAVPAQWLESILGCRPQKGGKQVRQPRPQVYWPVDVLSLAATLLGSAAR